MLTQTPSSKATSNYKIVIVEDEENICNMYKMKLVSAGFDVKTASNGQIGLEVIEEFRPKLILLDLKMPVMSGDEMLTRMRQTDWGADIRVVILTNISRDEAPRNLQFLGIDRYIVKAHHTPTQIINIVQEIL